MQVMLWKPPGECLTKSLRQNGLILGDAANKSIDDEEREAETDKSKSTSSSLKTNLSSSFINLSEQSSSFR